MPRNPTARGVVTVWHDDLGWGAIASPEAPGEVWAHFSAIELPDDPEHLRYRSLRPGQQVEFKYREMQMVEEGYDFEATVVRKLDPPPTA